MVSAPSGGNAPPGGSAPPGENAAALAAAADWLAAGRRVALATVVSTWGSAPRPPGARLVICDDGAFVGSVSGGCVEAAVITAAREVVAGGKPRLLRFGVADEEAWEVGLACGGEMEVFVEAVAAAPSAGAKRAVFYRLKELVDARAAAVLATDLTDGAHRLFAADGESGDDLPAAVCARARDLLAGSAAEEAQAENIGGGRFLFAPFLPPRRLLIAGAAHIAEHLSAFGRALGFAPFVADPRAAWAKAARFPAATVVCRWPDEAFADIGIDAQTAVVALSHDPKIDDPALLAALAAGPRYIGALGSRRTHAQRLARLREAGVSETALAKIHAPLGLPLGAKSPAEIALAAAAQIIAAYRVGAADRIGAADRGGAG